MTTCATCRFSAKEKANMTCRKNPPQVTIHLMPTGPNLAGQQGLAPVTFAAWPPVSGTDWCHSHEVSIAIEETSRAKDAPESRPSSLIVSGG